MIEPSQSNTHQLNEFDWMTHLKFIAYPNQLISGRVNIIQLLLAPLPVIHGRPAFNTETANPNSSVLVAQKTRICITQSLYRQN